MLIIGLTSV